MAAPSSPTNVVVQTGNGQNLVSWDITTGATSYKIQRSLDGVNYSSLATVSGVPLATSYLDTTPTLGTQYWYQVAASNIDGDSSYVSDGPVIPTTTGEMSLAQIRLAAKQRADRVNSSYITDSEWNSYINQAMFELYDILITTYEDYFIATPVQFALNGSTYLYPLPDGQRTFTNGITGSGTLVAPAYYKLVGVDLSLNNANNAWVTVPKFNNFNRNQFVYPNTASTIYGVFNLKYRVMGSNIEFIPTPSAGQSIRLWYVPRLTQLLQDTDMTTAGVSGWVEYAIVKAAILALTKEESDISALALQLAALKKRIEESAANRDISQPDVITDIRVNGSWNPAGLNGGFNGPIGGW